MPLASARMTVEELATRVDALIAESISPVWSGSTRPVRRSCNAPRAGLTEHTGCR